MVRQSANSVSSHRQALLAERARAFRGSPTASESLLWSAIRGNRMGVAFRRQVVIAGKYVADFAAPSARLVVEVDGGYHCSRGGADARRDRALLRLGWRVLRLDAEFVLRNLPAAVAAVRDAL